MGLRTALGLKKRKKRKAIESQACNVDGHDATPVYVRELYRQYPSLRAVEENLRVDGRQGALSLAPRQGTGVELGVFTGRFSEILYKATSPKKLYLVDGWRRIYGNEFPNWGAYTDYGRLGTEAALLLVHARAKHMGGDVEIVEETSTTWLKRQPRHSLDWAYLDTSHSYENTLHELVLLDEALKPHGVILGDDCRTDPTHRHHGVFRAVRDFCRNGRFEIVHMDTHAQWAIRRSREHVEDQLNDSCRPASTQDPALAIDDVDTTSWFEGKQFTSDWLSSKLGPWIRELAHLRDAPAQVLDVGSYEGRSCVAFLCLMSQSTVTAIDTFCSDEVALQAEQPNEVESRFDANLESFGGRASKIKGRVASILDQLQLEQREFDVIYLDAAKARSSALVHSVMAWPLLKKGGILIWDDLKWGGSLPSSDRPSDAIFLFCDAFRDSIEVRHCGRQMIVRKLSDWPVGRRAR